MKSLLAKILLAVLILTAPAIVGCVTRPPTLREIAERNLSEIVEKIKNLGVHRVSLDASEFNSAGLWGGEIRDKSKLMRKAQLVLKELRYVNRRFSKLALNKIDILFITDVNYGLSPLSLSPGTPPWGVRLHLQG